MNHAKMNVEIDSRTGIGLRAQHVDALLSAQTALSWVEVHSENWLVETGPIAERMASVGGSTLACTASAYRSVPPTDSTWSICGA